MGLTVPYSGTRGEGGGKIFVSRTLESVIISLRSCMINCSKALFLDFVSPLGVWCTQRPCQGNLL